MRQQHGIEGSCCGDCCVSFWCGCCALVQEEKEIELRTRPALAGYQAPPGMSMTWSLPIVVIWTVVKLEICLVFYSSYFFWQELYNIVNRCCHARISFVFFFQVHMASLTGSCGNYVNMEPCLWIGHIHYYQSSEFTSIFSCSNPPRLNSFRAQFWCPNSHTSRDLVIVLAYL